MDQVEKRPCRLCTIHQQFLMMLVALDLIVMAVFTGVLYTQQKHSLILGIDHKLQAVAMMARELLPPDYHDRINGPDSVSDDEFQRIVDRNNRLCVSLGLEYVWSLMMVDGKIVFTSATSPDKIADNRKHANFFEVHSNPELYASTFDSMRPVFKTNIDKWGRIRVALIPSEDGRGRKFLFGASISLETVNRQLQSIVYQSLGIGLVVFIGSVVLGYWVTLRVTEPIHKLSDTVQAIASGAVDLEAEEKGALEVMVLAKHINRLNRALRGKISILEASQKNLIGQHKVELEEAEETIISSDRRYQGLLNFAVDGILIGTNEGIITVANECMCTLFGLKRDEIVGRHITQMPFTRECLLSKPFEFDLVRRGQTLVRDRTIKRTDGSEVMVEIHTKMMADGTLQSIYRDITERKRVESSLAEARRLLEEAQRIAHLGGWEYDLETNHVSWTDEVYRIFGFDREVDLTDTEFHLKFFTPETRGLVKDSFYQALHEGTPYDVEAELVTTSGKHTWIRMLGQPVKRDGKVVKVTGSIMDVTDRRRVQQLLESWNASLERNVALRTQEVQNYAAQLQALTARLMRVEEDERKRISDVLHEDLQQMLVAARMTLGVVQKASRGTKAKEILSRTDSMLERSVWLTRSLVQDISVPAVREGDLPAAFRWIADQVKVKFDLTVTIDAEEGLQPVCESTYLCLYRAVQEILFNAVKHSKVLAASISVRRVDDENICVTIADGGVGFEVSELKDSGAKGIGLFGIRQRVEGLGGCMEIMSAVGEGTAVSLILPMRAQTAAPAVELGTSG